MGRRAFKLHDGMHGTALTIRVTPRARRTELGGIMEDGTLRVRVKEPPVEGKANKALIKYLAKILRVRKNQIEILAGEKGLDKIVTILDVDAEEVQQKLNEELDALQS